MGASKSKKENQGDGEQPPSYGEPIKYDPEFHGPVKKRSCTDIICLVLFLTFILGYIAVGVLAWIHGDPKKVIYPTESDGNLCGFGNYSDRPYLYYTNMMKCVGTVLLVGMQCPTRQICVANCPTTAWVADVTKRKAVDVYKEEFCQKGFNLSQTELTILQIVEQEYCAGYTIPSQPFMNRCFPNIFVTPGSGVNSTVVTVNGSDSIQTPFKNYTASKVQEAAKEISLSLDAREIGMKIFADFTKSWYWILLGLVIAMVVSLLFILLLRFIAPVLIWAIVIGVIVALGYGIWHCYWEYSNLKGKPGSDGTITDIGFNTNVKVYLQLRETWLAFMIILAIILAIILLVLIFLRKRILIAIAIIREASKAIGSMMSTLFYPILTFLLIAICISYWAITALYLATSGEPVYVYFTGEDDSAACKKIQGATCTPGVNLSTTCNNATCSFAAYQGSTTFLQNLFNLQVYNAFAFLWLMNFAIALGQCSLAGAFSSYFWTLDKKKLPCCPLIESFGRTLRYHTGSLAFGSLIIAIIQIIRVALEYVDHSIKGKENPVARFILCCMKCCFWCLEKFMKFINRNAYIMIAIHGKNFCKSAKKAFILLMRNILRVVVLDKVTDFLLMLGKLLVVGGVGVLSFFFFSGRINIPNLKTPTLNYYWVPILTVIVGAYMISHGFFSVYGMCIDTFFLCFLEDIERNDGSPQKPYHMPKSLMKILNKKNRGPKKK